MNCPRCNNAMQTMKKGNNVIDVCYRCGGIWFDENELVSTLLKDKGTMDKRERNDLVTAGFNKTITCPKCGKPTDEKNYCLDSGIMIDTCKACRGVFFDGGELSAVFNYLFINDLMDSLAEKTEDSLFELIKDFFRNRQQRVQISAQIQPRYCPRCKNVLMKEVEFMGEKVDCCIGCGGMWFDQGELASSICRLQAETVSNKKTMQGKVFEDKDMKCPCCGNNKYLTKHQYMSTSGIMVDSCKACEGVWMDNGDFEKIVHFCMTSREANKLAAEYQGLVVKIKKEHEAWQVYSRKIPAKVLADMFMQYAFHVTGQQEKRKNVLQQSYFNKPSQEKIIGSYQPQIK